MIRKYPILSRVLIFLVAPIIAILLVLYGHLKKSMPTNSSELVVAGLNSPVTIKYDEQGVPNVIASSESDAFFAQGYLHASERMWQMETQRRFTQGTASEIFGTVTVKSDIWMRTLGLYQAAEKSWPALSSESKNALTSYANGVNHWLDITTNLQPEFQIFNVKPKKWRAIDSLVWQKAFALSLGKNMDEEINRLFALKVLSPAQLMTFYPFDSDNLNLNAAKSEINSVPGFFQFNQFAENQDILKTYWGIGERFAGSNAWVVSGSHTISGKPILANDPHLSVQQPSIWYALQLNGGKLNAKGMSLVGLPGVILGRNESIAWGAAALMSDQQDLYILDIPLSNNKTYVTESGLKPINSHKELIHIRTDSPEFLNKAIEPIEIQVRDTELGPIISDTMGFSDLTFALKWSALDSEDNSYDAFYKLQFATNWPEFREATSFLKSPGIHFVYADKAGNIGSQVAASIPKRNIGNGTLPLRAQTSSNNWQGYVPFEQLPYQLNPESGFIIAANNEVQTNGSYTISHEWAPGLRYQRIKELLENEILNGKKIDINNMAEIQLDQVDFGAKKLLKILLAPEILSGIKNSAPEVERSLILKSIDALVLWDAKFDVDSYEATIYTYWVNALIEELFANDISGNLRFDGTNAIKTRLFTQITPMQLVNVLSGQGVEWCLVRSPRTSTAGCNSRIINSFINAISQLKKNTRSIDFEKDWKWGKVHRVKYVHKPLGKMKVFEGFFKNENEIGGNENTINAANTVLDNTGHFIETFGVSFRQIFDLSEDNISLYSFASGQSGHFMNEHYDDLLEPFIKGEYFLFSDFESVKKNSLSKKNMEEKSVVAYSAKSQTKVIKLKQTGAF